MKNTMITPIVAIILPAYNEELTIGGTIEDFHSHLPYAEIWVVDNNSSDNTHEVAYSTIESLGGKGGVLFESAKGKGNALRRAFHCINADVYLIADADMTYPASDAHRLLDPLLSNQADLVVGDRRSHGRYEVENKRPFHSSGNLLVCSLVNKLFDAKLNDIMSGYRAMTREFVDHYPILVPGFEIETDMTLHALDKRFRIKEIPIHYQDRPEGSFSKLNTFRDGFRVISTIVKILRYYQPFAFYGSISLALSIAGLLAGAPVIDEWLRTRFITHVPLAVLATGLEVLSVILLAIGLILDSMAHIEKNNFERSLVGNKLFNKKR